MTNLENAPKPSNSLASSVLTRNLETMATLHMSALIPKASLPLRALRILEQTSQISSRGYRTFRQRARPTLLATSSTRPRPLAHQSCLQSLRTPQGIIGGIRTIFIQTEITPNADVSFEIMSTIDEKLKSTRHLNLSQTTQYSQRTYQRHFSSISHQDQHWPRHILRLWQHVY